MDIEVDTKQRLFNQQTQLAKITAQIKDNKKNQKFLQYQIDCMQQKEIKKRLKLITKIFSEVGTPENIDKDVITGIAISLKANLLTDEQLAFFRQKARRTKC
ncbi:hypothetical protein [Megamonas funiformis]|uniref:hypothetical protein n=1 Tax=Megamonas funiformis TaxID=437897 RepID=UPI0026770596|nr:hypothetical protein [Megamonas funiformis]